MKWVRRVVALAVLAVAVVVAVSLLRGADTPSPPKLPDARRDRGDGPVDGTLAPTAGSSVGYRVRETVAGVGLNEAVGRTGEVDGSAEIVSGRIILAQFEADLRTLRSDEARRDEALRTRGLETDRFPVASFDLGRPVRIAERFSAVGTLTMHGYGMRPPSVAGVASVRDHGVMEVRLRLR